ncbi:hypothetical protein C8Q74DRAFT_313681 [Fomes fomentarius]|nr:hypothetical protein C8Q74DRAFT_313681 [Fomes fomentarius]
MLKTRYPLRFPSRVLSHCSLNTRLPVVITRGPRVHGTTAAVLAPKSPCSAHRAVSLHAASLLLTRETASNLYGLSSTV